MKQLKTSLLMLGVSLMCIVGPIVNMGCAPIQHCQSHTDCSALESCFGGLCTGLTANGSCRKSDRSIAADGESWQQEDGCNTCRCQASKITCTTNQCKGDKCGGPGSIKCKDVKEYCHYAVGCGNQGAFGICTPRPLAACSAQVEHVCGCDGNTYRNKCDAEQKGISIARKGHCSAPPKSCTADGNTHKDGDSWAHSDGCNTCTCKAGNIECTKKSCPPPTCTAGNKTYAEGETYTDPSDQCSVCTCKAGSFSCDASACTNQHCLLPDGRLIRTGEEYETPGSCYVCACHKQYTKCNNIKCPPKGETCSRQKPCSDPMQYCHYRELTCGNTQMGTCVDKTKAACGVQTEYVCSCDNNTYRRCYAAQKGIVIGRLGRCQDKASCRLGGYVFKHGKQWAKDCNTCTCDNGTIKCSQNRCKALCVGGGKIYREGDTWKAKDGCNTCECLAKGAVCTQKASCPQPKSCTVTALGTFQHGESWKRTNGCDICTCYNGKTSCTKIDCKQPSCGGANQATCKAPDTFCLHMTGCGKKQAMGICATKAAETCKPNDEYVCGCDGKTYGNACLARLSGVSVDYVGSCKP